MFTARNGWSYLVKSLWFSLLDATVTGPLFNKNGLHESLFKPLPSDWKQFIFAGWLSLCYQNCPFIPKPAPSFHKLEFHLIKQHPRNHVSSSCFAIRCMPNWIYFLTTIHVTQFDISSHPIHMKVHKPLKHGRVRLFGWRKH